MRFTQKICVACLMSVGLCLPVWAQPTVIESDKSVHLAMRNTQFNFIEDLGFYVYDLNATMRAKSEGEANKNELVNFDDPKQFMLDIHAGKVLVKPDALTTLFDRQVLAYSGAKMKNVTITTAQDEMTVQGRVKFAGMWLPMTMRGTLSVEDSQTLLMRPNYLKVLGLSMKGAMNALGMKISDVNELDNAGVKLDGDVIRLKVFEMFPPPAFTGAIQAVRVTDEGMELSFATQNPAVVNPPNLNSYVWMQGGQVRFFNIVLNQSHLLMKSEQADKPVEFFLYNYRHQIAERGRIAMAEDGGVSVVLAKQ